MIKRLAITLLAVAGLGLGLSTAASARDVSATRAPVAPAINWSGFYVGGHVGAGWANSNHSFADPQNAGQYACGPCFGPWASQNPSASDSSWIGGGHLGYNWQIAPVWLVGVEGDFTWSGMSTKSNTSLAQGWNTGALTTFPSSSLQFQTDIKWLASVRGRIGLTRDNWLAYFTGGIAWADIGVQASAACPVANNSGPVCTSAFLGQTAASSGNITRTGLVLGGGTEWQAPNSPWRARIEYMYYHFAGTHNASSEWLTTTTGVSDCQFEAGRNCSAVFGLGDVNIHTVRVGLTYAFH